MHYEWNAFSIDETKPTITAKDGSKIERPEDFSRVNIKFVNLVIYLLELVTYNEHDIKTD